MVLTLWLCVVTTGNFVERKLEEYHRNDHGQALSLCMGVARQGTVSRAMFNRVF